MSNRSNKNIPSSSPLEDSPLFAPPQSRDVPMIVLIIQTLLLAAAITMAALFVSFLFVEFHVEFSHTAVPMPSPQDEPIVVAPPLIEADIFDLTLPESLLYDFTQAVPESEAQPRSYFNDTVFIGDSRTSGLLLYTDLSPIDFSAVGLNVKSILTKAYIRLPNEDGINESYTLIDALTREKENYKSIYLSMGLNELGWEAGRFIQFYKETINAIREVTDVPIYMQLIMPITVHASETTQFGITNDKAVVFNEKLIKLAEEMELFMLDPRDLFALEDGTLDPEVTYDGIHFNPKRYEVIADYYCTHVVDMEAYDNLRDDPEVEDADSELNITDPDTEITEPMIE